MKKPKKAIKNDQVVNAYKYGDTIEMSTSLGSQPIMQKVNRDEMVNTITGEIKTVKHVEDRADPKNYESLRSTFKRLKRLIGANFQGGQAELWLTLTYRDSPMTDSKRLYDDFKQFIRRLRKATNKELAYIVIIEPQASGSLHAHLLLKTLDKSRLYIANDVVATAWGQGFVNVRRLKDTDNVSAYLMAYLTNVDLNNLEGDFEGDKDKSKKIIKGGRLSLYPLHMQIYRKSRKGIVQPTRIIAEKREIKKDFGLGESDYYRAFTIKKGDENFDIETEYYSISKSKIQKALKRINQKS